MSDLAEHHGLVNDHTPWRDRWRFAGDQVVSVHRRLASNSWDVLRGAALTGLGLVQLPGFQVADELEAGTLVEVLAAHRPADATDHVVARFGAAPPWTSARGR